MESINVRLTGTTPLMIKSDRTVDPLDPFVAKIKAITAKGKNRTEADVHALRRIEWESGFYCGHDGEPTPTKIPGWNIIRSLRDGATFTKQGKDVLRAVVGPEYVTIDYKGPKTLDAMYESGLHCDVRRVVAKGGGGATMRARPKFSAWSIDIVLDFDERMISRTDVLSCFEAAGKFAGIGEYRPSSPKGGQFGRYTVSVL